ncbi:MAG: DUF4097 family beta strand repeat-containing protein [Eubacteriales bacterium]|nr:DUF4097 family beta strand repeat-containing protein [Eubacteriales bacterium]
MDNMEINKTTTTPDNVLKLDLSTVKALQIGYHAETIFVKTSEENEMILEEYIGYTAYEYLAKVNANRFKTTIRYGRRESVNTKSYVVITLPKSWHGELMLYTQYGHISSKDTLILERLAAETSEGSITLSEVKAPRIRLVSSCNCILLEKAEGFADIHTTSGAIAAYEIDGGAKLETSTGIIDASFEHLSNVLECSTLSGDIQLTLPKAGGMNVDGITKTGEVSSELEGISVKIKPGNVKNVYGTIGEKPFQNVKINTINGSISIQ